MNRVLLLLLLALSKGTLTCNGKSNPIPQCVPSSCGEIHNISYPFRLKGDPDGCGDPKYELACENNRTVLYLFDGRYYVLSISYLSTDSRRVIRVLDDGLQKDNCSSLPRFSYPCSRLIFSYPYQCSSYHADGRTLPTTITIVNCSKPVTSHQYMTNTCMKAAYGQYLYALVGAKASDVEDFCTVSKSILGSYWANGSTAANHFSSFEDIHKMMVDGIPLLYGYGPLNAKRVVLHCSFGLNHVFAYRGWCQSYSYQALSNANMDVRYSARGTDKDLQVYMGPFAVYDARYLALRAADYLGVMLEYFLIFLAAKFALGTPCMVIFLVYKWRRRHLAMDANVEEFLQANNNFSPIRYSYSDIKKITKSFKHKLGEGGYGSVYQGKLRSGSEVAIKVLKKSKGNNQDFISEIATIGRIHHINVVQLVGFCIEGSKQALVYSFMPNGSLDKHIFSKVESTLLDCKKIYEIALGVARGIEYLHRGCDMQILHFDIKPHNILLDENFTPKVSDFGLARLYPTNHSIVTLTGARGTLGYMAPELFYRNIGGISYKADVYSFGMLLMEMASRRRNIDAKIERSSQIYFPLWIYDQLYKRELIELREGTEEERDVIIKMIVVALWCIQLDPNHRPSMKRVINMLEGNIDELQLPPKPLFYPSDPMPLVGSGETEIELEAFSSSSSTPLISAQSPV